MSRRREIAAVAVVVLVGLGGVLAAPAEAVVGPGPGAPTPALPDPCDLPAMGTAPLLGIVCAVPRVAGGATDAVGDLGGVVASGVMDSFAGWIASGAAGFLEQAGQAIFSGTEVDLFDTGEEGRPWFGEHYDKMALVGVALFAPMLMLAVLQAVFSQSFALLVRAVTNLPIAAIGTAAAVSIVGLLLAATDAASAFLASGLAGDTENFLDGIVSALLRPDLLPNGGPTVGLFGVALMALFMAFAAFVVWLELLVREAAIYLTVLFLPIGFATYIWPSLSSWLRRLMEVVVALILSKLVIVAALALAGSALAAQEGFPALVSGAGMLLLAAFAPFALFKLIPIASLAAISSMEGQGRRGVRAAMPRASSVFYARQLAHGGRSGGSRGAAPTPSRPAGENPPPPIAPGSGRTVSPGGGRPPVGSGERKPVGSGQGRGEPDKSAIRGAAETGGVTTMAPRPASSRTRRAVSSSNSVTERGDSS
ncbi:MAG: hypothetical protein M3535_10995 [Actinomycetota bacterium]|nr:hypothetical protein [Actinomycetota bacterium]MDQ3461902.1 hypothetical protein [Actinomycetota bacterium]